MALLRRVLGDTLRGQRMRQRRTLREVSGAARVSLGYLSEIERGQKEASSELLESICVALGVRLSDVLREVSDSMRRAEVPAPTAVPVSVPRVPIMPRRELAGAGRRPATAPVSRRPGAPLDPDPLDHPRRDLSPERAMEPVGGPAVAPTDGVDGATQDTAPHTASASVPAPAGGTTRVTGIAGTGNATTLPTAGPDQPAADVAGPVAPLGMQEALFGRVMAVGGDGAAADVTGGALFPRVGESAQQPRQPTVDGPSGTVVCLGGRHAVVAAA